MYRDVVTALYLDNNDLNSPSDEEIVWKELYASLEALIKRRSIRADAPQPLPQ